MTLALDEGYLTWKCNSKYYDVLTKIIKSLASAEREFSKET